MEVSPTPSTSPVKSLPERVVFWYKVYVVAMLVLYLVLVVLFSLGWLLDEKTIVRDVDMPVWLYYGYLTFLLVMCWVMLAAFSFALFLNRKPWTWVYHLVMICIGLTSPCCMPASIPLLIFWIKDDTRHYFGRK